MAGTMNDFPEAIVRSDDADFLRELVRDVAQRLMDIEMAAVCGAGHGERSPDRKNQRNGYRPRRWDTRAGVNGRLKSGHVAVRDQVGGGRQAPWRALPR